MPPRVLGVPHMHPFRKSFRGGAVLAIALAALVLLPGIAWAGNDPGLPAPAVPEGGAGQLGSMLGTGGSGSGSVTPNEQQGMDPADPASPTPPTFSPGDFGMSSECQAHVQADLTKAIQDIPATIQAIVDAIVAGLGSGAASPPTISIFDPQSGVTFIIQFLGSGQAPIVSSNPPDLLIVEDLQRLASDLQTYCSPSAQTTSGQTAATQSSAPVAAQAAVTTAAPPAPTTAAVAAAYPGYAPTGGRPAGPDPFALAGAGLLLVGGAGSTAYRLHRRATRLRG